MELLYIWIEEEKTFENAGFRFSDRYNFLVTFKSETREVFLSVKQNPDYIPDFFGKHIISFSGIIGENGSGKTNLLYLLLNTLTGYQVYSSNMFFVFANGDRVQILRAFHKRGDLELITDGGSSQLVDVFDVQKKSNFFNVFRHRKHERDGVQIIYYNSIYDFRDYPFQDIDPPFIDVSSSYLIWSDKENRKRGQYDMVAVHKSEDLIRQYSLAQSEIAKTIHLFKEIAIPTEVSIEVHKTDFDKNDLGYKSRELYVWLRDYGSITFQQHNNDIEALTAKAYVESNVNRALKEKAKTWYLVNLLDHFFEAVSHTQHGIKDENLNYSLKDIKFYNSYADLFMQGGDGLNWPPLTVQDYWTILLDFFNTQIFTKNESIAALAKESLDLIDSHASVVDHNEAHFFFPFEVGLRFIRINDKWNKALKNKRNNGFCHIRWRNLSSGETAFLNLFSRIYFGLQKKVEKDVKTVYLFIDEPDQGFHPHWQKNIIKMLIDFLAHFEQMKFQVILTSHSPILMSDLPKSSIIFLQKSKAKTVIQDSEGKSQTFGANIHTLFRDAFIIKDGVIGSFASEKIKSITAKIKKYGSKSSDEDVSTLLKEINTIGEPVLRNALKEELKKHTQDVDALIKMHESEILRLKRQKNDKN